MPDHILRDGTSAAGDILALYIYIFGDLPPQDQFAEGMLSVDIHRVFRFLRDILGLVLCYEQRTLSVGLSRDGQSDRLKNAYLCAG